VGPILLVKLIDKTRTIQLLEKLGISEIFTVFADGIFSLSLSSTILNPSNAADPAQLDFEYSVSLRSLGHRIMSHFDFSYIGDNRGQ
jgi:hypothetical protein